MARHPIVRQSLPHQLAPQQPYCLGVSDDRPLVRLPDEVVLSRDEVATVLAALDVSEGLAARSDEPLVRSAIRLLTAKLWSELGDLLGDDEQ